MSDPVDVLAIGAHPDDAEIGCAGVLIMSADAGRRVAVADLTAGELATHGSPDERATEARRAAEIMGLSQREALGLPDGGLGTKHEQRAAVVNLLRELRPRIVLAPQAEDRHPDHAAAGELTRAACFLAGVAKFGHGSPHRPSRLYHYMLHQPFTPSFVVDITAVWERKLAAAGAYASQFGLPSDEARTAIGGRRFLELLEDRASLYGAMIGVERGEAFRTAGPLGLAALPGLEDDPRGSSLTYRMFP